MMPCCRIESVSSCSASRAKSLRGCSALGTMVAKLIWWTLSPDSPVSGRVAADGVPISAPSPLPRPDRAMGLRLREQFHQRKQQSAQRSMGFSVHRRTNPLKCELVGHRASHLAVASQQTGGPLALKAKEVVPPLSKKVLKIVLTPQTGIWYHAPR